MLDKTISGFKYLGLAAMAISAGIEIERDLRDGFEYFQLHHGIAVYALVQLVSAVRELFGLHEQFHDHVN